MRHTRSARVGTVVLGCVIAVLLLGTLAMWGLGVWVSWPTGPVGVLLAAILAFPLGVLFFYGVVLRFLRRP